MRRNGQTRPELYLLLSAFFAIALQTSFAQTVTVTTAEGGAVQMSPAQARQLRKGGLPPGVQPGAPPAPQAAPEAKPEDKDKKKEGEDAKKKEAESSVKRPEKPPRVPDPREFKVKLDDKGRVPPFNFIGQPWPDVMQWLATISKCSLDWQELPSDYLNLTTQRSYTVDEVRDLINRHLNARGYVSLQMGEVLSVFKFDKVDPSLVRRVNEDQLYDLKPFDYVKVSFELPANIEVDKAKDDVKQLLSPSAKIFPLVTARRLVVMDSVANLRTVSEQFNAERMVQDGRIVPKEFVLKYARPQQVIEVLYMMVGADPKGKPQQTDPNAQAQQMQMIQQMQQQGRPQDAAKLMPKDAPKVYLAYNRHRNSVLVNAPPDLMKVIEQTIAYLDVPYGDNQASPAHSTTGANDGQRVMQRYSLTTLDPEKFVSTLEEIGGLSPFAEFKVDDNSKTLFAFATEADHKKIASLIRDFDGSGRHFDVIYLRKLPADAVAATIYKLMAGQNEKEKDKDRRRFFSWYDNDRDEKKKDTIQGFGVDADIENNRLLLWANDAEMTRVNELLVKLGEIPSGQQSARPVRVIESGDRKQTADLLKQLREAWSASNGNELIIKAPPEPKSSAPSEDKDKKEKPKTDKAADSAKDRSASSNDRGRIAARFVELVAAATDAAKPETAKPDHDSASRAVVAAPPPPITITVTPDGRLMLSSPDTAALDRMEQLIEKLSPPQRRFKVYRLAYIRAFDMWWDLKDYFKEDLEAKDKKDDTPPWYWDYRPKQAEDKSGPSLSKRRKMMITYDEPSNTILVANASASQTAEIEQLIKEFDQPAPKDSVEKRTTKAIKIKYSKPSIIAAAVKEVYRDLLSSRDKEFQQGDQKDKKRGAEHVTIIDYGGSGDDSGDRPSAVKVHFDGALSLGADDISGVLIVSAQQALINDIEKMVHELDEQAEPKTAVQVYQVHGGISAEALKKALDNAVGKAWLGNRPEQQPNQTGNDNEKKHEGEHGRNRNNRGQEGEKKE